MSKFGSLFNDSDEEDQSNAPAIVVPKPPPPDPIEAVPAAPPVAPPAPQDDAVQGPPPVASTPKAANPEKAPEVPALPLQAIQKSEPILQESGILKPNPSTDSLEIESVRTSAPPTPSPAQPQHRQQQQQPQQQQQQHQLLQQSCPQIPQTQLSTARSAPPRPATLPEDFPALSSFPSFLPSQSMAQLPRPQSFENDQERIKLESLQRDLEEKGRDAQVIGKMQAEQIAALRQEKDQLRSAIEALQSQLSQKEVELEQSQAREAQEMGALKASFKQIMQQQADQIDKLTAQLKESQSRCQSLESDLAAKADLLAARERTIQNMELSAASLTTEKNVLEGKLSMKASQLEATRVHLQQYQEQLKQMDDVKAKLHSMVDELVQSKQDYAIELRKRHDETLDALRVKFEQREAFFMTDYATKEQRMREDFLQFTQSLQTTLEAMLGGFRDQWEADSKTRAAEHTAELQRLTNKHKAEMKKKDEEIREKKQELVNKEAEMKKVIKELEDKSNKREAAVRESMVKEKQEATEHLRKEIAALEKRLKERGTEMDQLILNREKDTEQRLLRLKQEHAKVLQQAQLDAKAKTAELEAQHRVRESQLEKRAADDKEQLMTMFQRELAKISEEHRKAERDLEKAHRDREAELEKRVRVASERVDDKADGLKTVAEGNKLKDDFLGKWESHRQSLRERHENARKSMTT